MTVRGFFQLMGILAFMMGGFCLLIHYGIFAIIFGVVGFVAFVVLPGALDWICDTRGHVAPGSRGVCFRCGEVMR